jgi:cupin 2 domain-containing protein
MPNLFDTLATDPTRETFDELLSRPGVRIERIVSNGQVSPDGFYYDQDETEWVALLSGHARLHFADEAIERELKPGDYLTIAPHRRHRVTFTAPATVWLAVWLG